MPWSFLRETALGYALAPIAVVIAFAVRLMLIPMLHDDSRYLLFMPAVLVAAAIGGLGPGLLATGLSAVLGLVVSTSFPELSTPEAMVFTVLGVGIAWSGDQLQRHRMQAAASARDALGREAHLQSILDTVPDAMIVIDERGIMQSFSSAAERLFGFTAAEALGKTSSS